MDPLRDRLDRLDERTGAATFGHFASIVGGYGSVLIGLAGIVFGVLDLIERKPGAVAGLAIGIVLVGVGIFVGPPRMFRRLVRGRTR